MTIKASTGLRNQLQDTAPMKTILAGGFIKLYSGTPPDSADDAIGGGNTLLTTIDSGGNGLTMGTSTNGVLPKNPSETWSGVNSAGGVATFYRHVAVGDTGAASTTQARLQGDVSTIGSDMNITAGTTLSNGATQTLNLYQIFLPSM